MIASLATGIALEMGLPREEIERIRVASLLHDLGKLAVPPEILDKPTALSDGEWQAIGEHPRIGQLILEQASSLREAIPVVLHHHERFNGGGYPHGLRGNEIPMGARIVAVADAYHAMVHDRPYKTALDHEQAMTELRQNAGTQFDPDVVERLLRRLRRRRSAGWAGRGLPPPRARPGRARADRSPGRRGGPGRRSPHGRRTRRLGPQVAQPIGECAVRPRGDRLMSRRRVAVLLAILAALAGAPSSVSAALPNRLSQASVTPLSGDPSTVFVVTVRYRSAAGNPANAVSVNAGGQLTAMTLVSGTATDGTWSGTTNLPPGAWDITVEASVATGPQPSLLAGTVSVAGAAASPAANGGNAPSKSDGPDGEGGGPGPSPVPQPAATSAPTAMATLAPTMRRTAVAPSQPPTGPARGVAPAGPGRSGEAPARPPRANRTSSSVGAQVSASATPGDPGTTAPRQDSGDLGLAMLIGTLTVGVVGAARVGVAARRGAAWPPSRNGAGRRCRSHRRPASPASRAPALDRRSHHRRHGPARRRRHRRSDVSAPWHTRERQPPPDAQALEGRLPRRGERLGADAAGTPRPARSAAPDRRAVPSRSAGTPAPAAASATRGPSAAATATSTRPMRSPNSAAVGSCGARGRLTAAPQPAAIAMRASATPSPPTDRSCARGR